MTLCWWRKDALGFWGLLCISCTEVKVLQAVRLWQELAQQSEASAGVGALGARDDVKRLVHLPHVPHLE